MRFESKKLKALISAFLILCIWLFCIFTPIYANADAGVSYAFLGGDIIGFEVDCGGVLVTDVYDRSVQMWQLISPLKKGDIITKINGFDVNISDDINEILNSGDDVGVITVEFVRNGQKLTDTIETFRDSVTNNIVLGVSVKDNICGLGTVTCIGIDGSMRALGHEISDGDTGIVIDGVGGRLLLSGLTGIVKGKSGMPGTVKGYIGAKSLGSIESAGKFGIKGNIITQDNYNREFMKLAGRNEIKPGYAQICTAVSGKREFYDIKIIKCVPQKEPDSKSMVIKITDKRLIDLTGGIIQGMSGSPIVQNGAIVGAVTHVFINDSTMGYGIYMDWMW